ncbi:MAG: hypothetical protein GY757_21650 [bacterium]|nr:hypothetical protein [bacterium]
MALVLDAMASSGKKISGIVQEFPKYKRLKRSIPLPMSAASRIISILKDEFPNADLRDGMRVDCKDYWFHVRPSNTEPVLRIFVEGKQGIVQKVMDDINTKIVKLSDV